ncbi:FAD-dependent oxidoreductase [Thermoanaerobacter sp. CM-CNRG TB177]|uniref:FAD-dependent pyridine nucleotide-disulphide oxidoreductase n=2 Tax=Thermoanaerobacter TaxID=1754 RepID=B0K756_THEP3|nr:MULTISPECIES: FAD-dependent oxidoreductase [Thermoanaerobacter]HHW57764.1 FAD-dependent oxidoreductase [Clostridia bacterium]ABY92321.1 FAD-dependent pyridine nucleotide-disulphide oxidoreductase [Thermoanaerobacter sp. X514]ABY94203.1 FAD-dependent pyridine nucleotide-disulphide oxidoreductase [Thermoanaerobacter pseudethanolicus ATCC 33223]ADV79156.1 FAD-dependent pyridine nucleotide-disulfide oxidoreductase [Thermoanaerobacter brockii subsp. finnii Ako-1]MBT1280280.1 FAD-dependent oxidor
MLNYDIVIIGGGPAGLGAAVEAYEKGVKNIVIIERDKYLGGILEQCIHNGFGLQEFKEELTGPEYAQRFIDKVEEYDINVMLETMVLEITPDRIVKAVNSKEGVFTIKAGAIILAMGCRERPRGAIMIPGTRPAGILTAGTAQRYVNMEGYLPGKEIVILGSGDVGLIMARRLTLEGAKVKAVVELMPYSSGLTRNIVQCLEDFNIPLLLSHTVIEIHGKDRVEGVTIAKVDENREPIMETAQYISCDTLILSVGLIPENELSQKAGIELDPITGGPIVNEMLETSVPGIFACGNVLQVHDLVDNVTAEARLAANSAIRFIREGEFGKSNIAVKAGNGIRYVVPQKINVDNIEKRIKFRMRPVNVYNNAMLAVKSGDKYLLRQKRQRLTPGEMIDVNLSKDILKNANLEEGIVFLVEEG